jgi:uncharacterized membrane protein
MVERQKFMNWRRLWTVQDRVDFVMLSVVLAHLGLFFWLAVSKLHTFHAESYDLAIFVRAVWGILHGDIRIPLMGGVDIWSIYLSPLLVVLAQFCRFLPTAEFLLFVQAGCLALTGWIVYCAARSKLAQQWGAWGAMVVGTAVLMHPSIHNANLFAFHMSSLAIPLLSLFLYFESHDDLLPATIFLTLAMVLREEVAGVLLVFGFVQVWRKNKFGAVLILLALLWVSTAALLKVGQPTTWKVLATSVPSSFGLSWMMMVGKKLRTMQVIFLAFLYLPLRAPRTLLWGALPALYYLLSPTKTFGRIEFHYFSLLVPFLAFATVEAMASPFPWQRWLPVKKIVLAALCIASLLMHWGFAIVPWGRIGFPFEFKMDSYAVEAENVLPFIRPEDSVVAPIRLLTPLSQRREIYVRTFIGADVVILDKAPAIFVGESREDYRKRLENIQFKVQSLIEHYDYKVFFDGKWLLGLRKKRSSS